MFNLKNRYPIGIDINDRNIYATQFQKTRQGMAIRELFHRKLATGQRESTGPDEPLISILKEIAKNKRFRGKSVAIHLPAKHVYSFPATFEIGSEETIKDGIARECRRHLSFPLEEAVVDYPYIIDISSGKNNKFNALIVAARRDQIQQYIHLLKRAGLWVEAIDFNLSSLLRLHNYLFPTNDAPIILCNIGHDQSIIAVVTQNSILAQRNTSWGINHILNRLENNLKPSGNSKQAVELIKKFGLNYEHQINSDSILLAEENGDKNGAMGMCRTVFQILAPYVDGLIHEFYQITGYVRSERHKIKFEKIYMYGQANLINSLDQYIKRKFDIPAKSINPVLKFTISDRNLLPDTTEGTPFALALGLAMRRVI